MPRFHFQLLFLLRHQVLWVFELWGFLRLAARWSNLTYIGALSGILGASILSLCSQQWSLIDSLAHTQKSNEWFECTREWQLFRVRKLPCAQSTVHQAELFLPGMKLRLPLSRHPEVSVFFGFAGLCCFALTALLLKLLVILEELVEQID